MTVMVVIGTRPEAIKMAPVVRALRAQGDRMRPVVLVTGQHREMLDQVLQLFDIAPDIDLDVMAPNQTLASLTAKVMTGVDAAVRDILRSPEHPYTRMLLDSMLEGKEPMTRLLTGSTQGALDGANKGKPTSGR